MLIKIPECFCLNLHFISAEVKVDRTQTVHWLNGHSLSIYFLPVAHVTQLVPTCPCAGVELEKLLTPMPLLFIKHGVHFTQLIMFWKSLEPDKVGQLQARSPCSGSQALSGISFFTLKRQGLTT